MKQVLLPPDMKTNLYYALIYPNVTYGIEALE